MSQEDAPAEGSTPAAPAETEGQTGTAGKVFEEAYVKQLRAEAAKYRTEAQEARGKVEEFESANQSELEKLTGKLSKIEKERDEAKATLLRFEIAKEKEVPTEAVDLLSGNTREELEASADKILSLVKSRNEPNPAPDFDGGAREPAPDPETPEQAHNKSVLALLGLSPE